MTREKIAEILNGYIDEFGDMQINKCAEAILAAIAEEKPSAPADLVMAVRELIDEYEDDDNRAEGYLWADKVVEDIEEILSRHEAEEPLAVTAAKRKYDMKIEHRAVGWIICVEPWNGEGNVNVFRAPTYAAAESAARAYLAGLPAVERRVKK